MSPDFRLSDVLNIHYLRDRRSPTARRSSFGKGRVAYIPSMTLAKSILGTAFEWPTQAAASSPIGAVGFGKDYWRLPANSDEIAKVIRYAVGTPLSVEFDGAPLTTVIELTDKKNSSERILHWI